MEANYVVAWRSRSDLGASPRDDKIGQGARCIEQEIAKVLGGEVQWKRVPAIASQPPTSASSGMHIYAVMRAAAGHVRGSCDIMDLPAAEVDVVEERRALGSPLSAPYRDDDPLPPPSAPQASQGGTDDPWSPDHPARNYAMSEAITLCAYMYCPAVYSRTPPWADI